MKELQKVENGLGKLFESAPKISESGRESIVKALPVLALVFGALQLVAAYWLSKLARAVEALDNLARSFGAITGVSYGPSGADKFMIYVGVALLVVDAVLLLLAYSGLAKRKKRGWDLLFLGALVNVAYGVLSLFITGRGFGTLVFSVIGSALTMWILFQVRGKYTGVREKLEDAVSGAVKDVKKVVSKTTKKVTKK